MPNLTPRQQQVLDFIRFYRNSHGYVPTVREIGLGMNIKSPNGVCCHLRSLKKKGLIRGAHGRSRAMVLVEDASPSPDKQEELRLTLLWYFKTADARKIHEEFVRRPGADDAPEMTFEQMLAAVKVFADTGVTL